MWAASLAGLGALAHSSTVWADPIELVEQRPTYMIFDDVDDSVRLANWYNRNPFLEGYRAVEDGFLAEHADDSQFIIVYTTWELFSAGALYQAVANDVRGIGYEHLAASDPVVPAPYFDDTPNSQVQGFLHMSEWARFVEQNGEELNERWISLAFGQELGHAWLAFVHFDDGGGPSDAMLGRSDAHWSYYLHTDGSPIEGHRWADNGDGTFTATKLDRYQFSDLDLYLMGLLPAQDVAPWFLIEDFSTCIDSDEGPVPCPSEENFGFQGDTLTVSGTRRDITVDDVIRAEGGRDPAYGDAPDEFDLAFLLIKQPDEELDDCDKLAVDAIIRRSIEMWEDQTRGLGALVNRTADPAVVPEPAEDCPWEAEPEPPGGDDTGTGTGTGSETDDGGAGTGDGGSSGDGGSTDPAPTDGGGTEGTGTGSGAGEAAPGSGCACRSAPGSATWTALLLLALVRRRS